MLKGRDAAIVPACSDFKACVSPVIRSPSATKPKTDAQKIRCLIDVSVFPPAVIISTTNAPELTDVVRKITRRIIEITDVTSANGICSSIWNSTSDVSVIPLAISPMPC